MARSADAGFSVMVIRTIFTEEAKLIFANRIIFTEEAKLIFAKKQIREEKCLFRIQSAQLSCGTF